MNLQWPNFDDFTDDENQDVPKEGELIDAWCDHVFDVGIPLSEDGERILEHLCSEMVKRDQESRMMHVYRIGMDGGRMR